MQMIAILTDEYSLLFAPCKLNTSHLQKTLKKFWNLYEQSHYEKPQDFLYIYIWLDNSDTFPDSLPYSIYVLLTPHFRAPTNRATFSPEETSVRKAIWNVWK